MLNAFKNVPSVQTPIASPNTKPSTFIPDANADQQTVDAFVDDALREAEQWEAK